MSTEKKTLSIEEIEAQTALELPEREVMQAIVIGSIVVNAALAANFCPAAAVGIGNVAATYCVAAAVAQQSIG
jgi:hypothetical protein